MTELAVLATRRATLPRFPGATIPEQLASGRAAALGILRRYQPDLRFDEGSADEVLAKVSVWEERNRAELEKVFENTSASALPEAVRVSFNKRFAQDFVIAGFTKAAAGMGPWLSGAVQKEALSGEILAERWAREDAEYRLQTFGAIVKMEEEGFLAELFGPDPDFKGFGLGRVGGYGALPVAVVVAIAVATVAVAGLFLLYLYSAKRLELNNRLMRDVCERAQKRGDDATVESCVEATRGLQAGDMIPGMGDFAKTIGWGLVLLAGAYVAVVYGPTLLEEGKRRKRARYA